MRLVGLVHVLDVVGQLDPWVLSGLVDREDWGWEAWIGEGAYWDGDESGQVVDLVIDGRAAGGAEVECCRAAGVPGAYPLGCTARSAYPLARPARLRREDAARALLTRQAVAHRNPNRVALADHAELAATTRSTS